MKNKIFLSFVMVFAFYIPALATANKATSNKYKAVEATEKDPLLFKGLPFPQRQNISAGLGVDYFDSFGIQTRYAYRIIDDGFIDDVNDSFYIEGGLGLTMYGSVNSNPSVTGFNVLASVRWDFQYNPEWTMFADLGFGINSVSKVKNGDVPGGGFFPAIGVGTIYSMNETTGIRFDLSYQFLGLGIFYRF